MSFPTLRRGRRAPLVAGAAVALAIGLVAAACGGSESTQTEGSQGAASQPEAPASTQSSSGSAPTANADATEAAPAPTGGESNMGASPGLPAPDNGDSSPPTEPTPEPTPVPESDLPAVDVLDVATGDTVNLASFIPSDRHILVWFWAPH